MRWSLLGLFFLVFICSCDDFFENETGGWIYGDVFITSIADDGSGQKFAPVFYVYANRQMDSALVCLSGSSSSFLPLDSLELRYTFARFPSTGDFSTEIPQSGSYQFKAFFENGSGSISTDLLLQKTIEPPVLTLCSFNQSDQNLDLTWSYDANAQNHKVTLLSNNGEVLFESGLLRANVNSIRVEDNASGWLSDKHPADNDSITIVVQSYLFEEEVSSFDLQCLAVSRKAKIVWKK